MSNKVLITDFVHGDMIPGLESLGYESDYQPNISLAEVHSIIQDYVGIIVNSKVKMSADLMDKAPHLRFIGRLGSGLEIINLEYAEKKGIKVFNSPEGNRNAVAEHAVALILNLANNIRRGDKEVRSRIWDRESNRGIELESKTLGIIGFGHTGSSLATKFQNWGMDILVYDKYREGIEMEYDFVKSVSLRELQQQSDVISLHLPLTSETKFLINRNFLSSCKKNMILINTSRGAVVNTADLLEYIENKHISAAGLDVYENEKPLSYNVDEQVMYEKLFNLENVILTPHVAGWTHLSLLKITKVLLNKISKL